MNHRTWTILLILVVSNWAVARTTLTLPEFLSQVELHSPDLKIEKATSEEALAKAKGIRIPPPMVGLMQMKDGGGTNQGIEVSQELPFPTKISAEKETRKLESDLRKSNFSYRKNEILSEARTTFFEFWSDFEKTEIIKEKRNWLKKHARLARTLTRSDSTAQLHLLGIESDVDMLENDVLEAEASLLKSKNRLKLFAPTINVDQIEPEASKFKNVGGLNKPSSSLSVQLKQTELKTIESQKKLIDQAYLPNLLVRYRGYNGNSITPKSEELMVGVTLPFIYFWQPKAESAEASARLTKAQSEVTKTQVEFDTGIQSLSALIESMEKQLLTLESILLPRAHRRMKLVDNLSPRSMEGLEEHRTVMLSYLDLKLKAVEVRAQLEKSIAELTVLTVSEGEVK